MPTTKEDTITLIPVSQLKPHPKNPRVALRDDVVEAIAADLENRGHMEARHAITVRAVEDGYEIISGHHRHAAAVKAGLAGVPCWVVEMDDDTAYMALATSNNQGELAPLEIGLHALECVGKAKAGRGKKGGLSEHARKIGKTHGYLSQLVSAAEVAKSVSQLTDLIDKAQHLHAIHAEERRELWPALVSSLLSGKWSVADTEHWVGKVKEFDIPERCSAWLPLVGVVDHFLQTKEFSPSTVRQLVAKRDAIFELLEQSRDRIEESDQRVEHYAAKAEEWLVSASNAPPGEPSSWDVRDAHRYLKELEEEISGIGLNQWLFGNWREHLTSIKDGSIAVLLTDPPYGMGYQSNYRLDTRKDRKHDKIENDAEGEGPVEMAECVSAFVPKLAADAHVFVFTNWRNEEAMRNALADAGLTVKSSIVWVKNNTGMGDLAGAFAPKHERIIHAVKGSPILFEREADVLEFDRVSTDRHPTEKPVDLLSRLIEITSVAGQRVADPFGGVGSTCEAALSLGRNYWGCELKEDYYEQGKARLDGLEQVGG
jgi:DNA modification methylase/ParB-like chromosome segregation protein Spo0J